MNRTRVALLVRVAFLLFSVKGFSICGSRRAFYNTQPILHIRLAKCGSVGEPLSCPYALSPLLKPWPLFAHQPEARLSTFVQRFIVLGAEAFLGWLMLGFEWVSAGEKVGVGSSVKLEHFCRCFDDVSAVAYERLVKAVCSRIGKKSCLWWNHKGNAIQKSTKVASSHSSSTRIGKTSATCIYRSAFLCMKRSMDQTILILLIYYIEECTIV